MKIKSYQSGRRANDKRISGGLDSDGFRIEFGSLFNSPIREKMQSVTAEQLLAIEYAKHHFHHLLQTAPKSIDADEQKIALLYEKYNEAMDEFVRRDQAKLKTRGRS